MRQHTDADDSCVSSSSSPAVRLERTRAASLSVAAASAVPAPAVSAAVPAAAAVPAPAVSAAARLCLQSQSPTKVIYMANHYNSQVIKNDETGVETVYHTGSPLIIGIICYYYIIIHTFVIGIL